MSDALVSENTTISIGTGDAKTVAYAADTFVEIGEVTDFDLPGGDAPVIDVTHLKSTRREKRMGIPDEGQMTLSVNWIPGNTGQAECREARAARRMCWFKVEYEDGTIDRFTGYVLGVGKSGAGDAKVSGSITVEITGEVTLVEAA